MGEGYSFHPEALFEYAEAARYYLREASPRVSEAFVTAVEFAIAALIAAPERWRVVEEPEIRRYVFSRFPFVIYYRWEPQNQRIAILRSDALQPGARILAPAHWTERLTTPLTGSAAARI